MMPLVSIVIVVWNGVEDTLECLRSLAGDRYPHKEVLIVDNGSTDGSLERIQEAGFDVHVVKGGLNLGFTGGNNVGMAEAQRRGAKYVFLLNNDTTVEPDALTLLVEAAERSPGAALLSPVIHYYDAPEEIWFSGARLSLGRGEALHQNLLDQSSQGTSLRQRIASNETYASSWISGCAMLVNMNAVDRVGGFDDRFFLTWEDVDWCVRMRRSGWEVAVVPAARIYHKCGRSGAKLTGVHRYYAVRNSLLLSAKHAGPLYLLAMLCVLGRHLRSALRFAQSEKMENIGTISEGFKDHLLGRYGRRLSPLENPKGRLPIEPDKSLETNGDVCVFTK